MPRAAEKIPIVLINSSTGIPLSTCTFLKTCSAIGGFGAGPAWTSSHASVAASFIKLPPFSFPCRIDRLAHQESLIDALAWTELLDASAVHFSHIEVTFLVHAEAMHAPEAAGEVSPYAPGVEEMSVQIIFQHPGGTAVKSPQRSVRTDVNQMNVGRFPAGAPFVQVLSVFIEDLNAMIRAVVHEDSPGLRIDCDAVHVIHIAGSLFVWRRTLLSPTEEKLAVLVELRDTRSVVPIGHEHGAVRKPCQKRRPVEMSAVGAAHPGGAYGLDELFSVVCELVNGVHVIVQHPHILVRIVRIDGHKVRALQNLVPLGPAFDDVSVGVRHQDAVLPFRVDAECAVPPVRGSAGHGSGCASSGQRGSGRIAPGQAADRELNAWTELRQHPGCGPLDIGQLSPEKHEYTVRTFRVHTLARAKRPLFIAGQSADVFRPSLHDFIRPEDVLASLCSGNRGKTGASRGLPLRLKRPIGIAQQRDNGDRQHNEQQHRNPTHNTSHRRVSYSQPPR